MTVTDRSDTAWPVPRSKSRQLRYQATVADAYGVDVAETLCMAWSGLHPPSRDYGQCLRLLLHEAVSNALLHGGLEVSGFNRTSVEDFQRHNREINERLGQATYANRTIAVIIDAEGEATCLTVEDEGQGYEPSELPKHEKHGGLGRGMRLIHNLSKSVTVDNGGRRIMVVVAPETND